MRLRCDHFATTKTDSRKEVSVLLKSPQGLRSIATLYSETAKQNRSRAVFEACTKDGPRLIWSLRVFGRKAVLFSSQIGFRLNGDQFLIENGGDSLQTSGDLSVTDQR